MATILTTGIQFFDSVGVPLAGGFLKFYSAGTLTLKAIYDAEDEGSQLTNPLELDSEGRVPAAGVWLNGAYRLRVTDSDGVVIYDIDDLNFFDPYDWTGLTATIADLNQMAGALGTPGTVLADKAVVVDSNKDIATFGILSAATLRASTAVRTPQINDANNVAAVTIDSVSSQVNAVKLVPAITTNTPQIRAYGSDTNIDLKVDGQGTGKVVLSGIKYPTADGTSGQLLSTNGSGVLSFISPGAIKQVVSSTTESYLNSASAIPFDDTIPQSSEGYELLTITLTPQSASSNLYIDFSGFFSGSTANTATFAIFRDSGVDALYAGAVGINTTYIYNGKLSCVIPSTAASSTVIKVRVGCSSGTLYINGLSSGRKYGGVMTTMLTVTEV